MTENPSGTGIFPGFTQVQGKAAGVVRVISRCGAGAKTVMVTYLYFFVLHLITGVLSLPI